MVLNSLALNPRNGYWTSLTPNHVYVWSSYYIDYLKIPSDNKNTLGQCVEKWIL
jgi:hypothetical protein